MFIGSDKTIHRLERRFDRFGKDIQMVPDDEKHFTIHTDIEVSPQFFGWVCGLGKAVRILAPAEVVEEMGDYVKGIAEMY